MPVVMTGSPPKIAATPACDSEGSADRIATGIDKVQGDYDDLPPKMKLLMVELRKKAKSEGIDMERTFQAAGGSRYGTIKKARFDSSLRVAFHHFRFSEPMMADLVAWYGVGQEDTVLGGKDQVAWRDFTNDVLMALPPSPEQTEDLAADNYMDGVASAFDRVAGDFDDLPPPVQQVLRELKAMAKREHLDVEAAFKDACRARDVRLGVMPTDKFLSCLRVLFHHYIWTKEALLGISTSYGYGELSVGALGGKEMISWRDFLNDLLSADAEGILDPLRTRPYGNPELWQK